MRSESSSRGSRTAAVSNSRSPIAIVIKKVNPMSDFQIRFKERIPILMITGEPNLNLISDSFSAGATAFLPKPFTPEQLESAIRILIGSPGRNRRAK